MVQKGFGILMKNVEKKTLTMLKENLSIFFLKEIRDLQNSVNNAPSIVF